MDPEPTPKTLLQKHLAWLDAYAIIRQDEALIRFANELRAATQKLGLTNQPVYE